MIPDDKSLPIGRFERVCESYPPLELEWDSDSIDSESKNWPIGRFERTCESYPPVDPGLETDPPALVLTLQIRPEAEAAAVGYDVSDLLLRLGRLEQSLGGAGFIRENADSASGTIRLVLVPVKAENAANRLRAVAENIKAALQDSATVSRVDAEVRIAA
jgi:hypothetical protein